MLPITRDTFTSVLGYPRLPTGLWAERSDFNSRQGHIFIFSAGDGPALGPTQQTLCPRIKCPGQGGDISPPLSVDIKVTVTITNVKTIRLYLEMSLF